MHFKHGTRTIQAMNTGLSLRTGIPESAARAPLWIQRARRRPDRAGWLILALCLLPLLPLLLQTGFPGSSQLDHYAFQVENSAQSLREGRLYPRWSPNAVSGFGSPLPSFTPPLPSLVPGLIQVTLTDSPEVAIKLTVLIAQVIGAMSVYRYATLLWGFRAGAVSALMWSYTPMIGLSALYASGELPVFLAACLMPLWLLSMEIMLRPGRPRMAFVLVMLSTAGLMFTLPVALLAVAGLFLCRALGNPRLSWERAQLPEGITAVVLGLCVAACYWLPAALEASAVSWWSSGIHRPWAAQLTDLLHPFPAISPWLANPPLVESIGLGGMLVLAGVASAAARRMAHIRTGLIFSLAGLVCALAAWSTPEADTWNAAAGLALALGAGALMHSMMPGLPQLAVVLGVIVLAGAPVLIAARWPSLPRDYSQRSEIDYQRRGMGEAVLPTRQSMPSNIAPDYGAIPSLLDSYSSGSILKVALGETSGIDIGLIAHESHGDRFQIFNQSDRPLRILTGYFPGWAATINNQPIEITPDADGFIQIQLQGASGELYVGLGPTPTRMLAWILTWGGFVVTAVLALFILRPEEQPTPLHTNDAPALSLRDIAAVLPAVALAVLILVIGPSLSATLMPFPAVTTGYLTSAPVRTENGIELVSIERTPLVPGSGEQVVLYWRIARFVETSFGVRLSGIDPNTGTPYAGGPVSLIGGLPSQQWPTGRLIRDTHILEGDTAGDLFIEIIACESARCADGTSVTLVDRAGNNYPSGIRVPG